MKNRHLKFLISILLFTSNLYSQNKINYISIEKSNAFIEVSTKEVFLKERKLINNKEKRISLIASFKNNPFQLDNTYKALIILDKDIIFDGNFSNYGFKVFVPVRLLNKKLSPKVIIYRKNKFYLFSCDQALKTITNKDNIINVIFMPTNDSESMYFISTDWKINEN